MSRLDRDLLLLDMGGTFMFECDRFADPAALHATYRALGGAALDAEAVQAVFADVLATLGRTYVDPACHDDFPTVAEFFRACPRASALPAAELAMLEATFARHERGVIPSRSVRVLHALALRYRLGVVSNVWAPSAGFRQAFTECGIDDLFDVVVFSSDHRCVKPSERIFRHALAALGVSPERVTFVGDDLRCDIAGAQAVGMRTVWIDPHRRAPGPVAPTHTITDLAELLTPGLLVPLPAS
jgi:putative hydrolase of the HAD superfamily